MSGAQLVALAAWSVQWGTFRMACERWIREERARRGH